MFSKILFLIVVAFFNIPEKLDCLTTWLKVNWIDFIPYVFNINSESKAGLILCFTGGSWALSPKKITFEDKVKSAQDAGSPEAFLQGELGKISKGLSEDRKNKIYQKIFEIVQNAYPDSANIQEIVNKEIDKYEKAQKSKTFVRSQKDVSDPNNTEKPVIQDDKGEDITNPNFKYSGAI